MVPEYTRWGYRESIVLVLVRRRRSLELVAAVVLPFPLIYAASSFTADRLEPRYLVLLAPILALLLATLLVNRRLVTLGVAAAVGLAVVALLRIDDAGGIAPGAPDVRAPARLGPLVRILERVDSERSSLGPRDEPRERDRSRVLRCANAARSERRDEV